MNGLELWKEIPAFPKYMASDLGNIKNKKTGKIKKGFLSRWGYLSMTIQLGNSQQKVIHVHSLIMETFKGPKPQGFEIHHRDGDKLNNKPENLDFTTRSQNCSHAYQAGLKPKKFGKANPQTKLTEEQVIEIRRLKAGGIRLFELAKRFNVNDETISSIIKGKTWSWLK